MSDRDHANLAPGLARGPTDPGWAPALGGAGARGFPLAGGIPYHRLVRLVTAARRLPPRRPAPRPEVPDVWDLVRRHTGAGAAFWERNPFDPLDLLALFTPLALRPGFSLVSFRRQDGGNARGRVWAVPAGAELVLSAAPDGWEPELAGGNPRFLEAVVGDGSAWSYLLASLFAREAEDLGAEWHGIWWRDHYVLTDTPPARGGTDSRPRHLRRGSWADALEAARCVRDGHPDWRLAEGETVPVSWAPAVEEGPGGVTVVFHSYSALGTCALYRHEDRYTGEGCYFETTQEAVAHGPGGFVG